MRREQDGQGKAVQVDPMKPIWKPPGNKHLKLQCDIVLSTFALKFNLRRYMKVTGIQNMGNTVSVLVRGSNKLVIEEAERSLHDALCVIRCLVQKRFLIVGRGLHSSTSQHNLSRF